MQEVCNHIDTGVKDINGTQIYVGGTVMFRPSGTNPDGAPPPYYLGCVWLMSGEPFVIPMYFEQPLSYPLNAFEGWVKVGHGSSTKYNK